MALLSFGTDQTNVVELLRKDHETLKTLFRDFEAAGEPDQKLSIVRQAITELEIHTSAEEVVFYPAVRKDSPDAAQQLDESLEEHHVVKFLMRELKRMSPEEERFDAKFRVLTENVKHHIKEEEAELFARARTGNLDLVKLGKQLKAAKKLLHSSSVKKPVKRTASKTSSKPKRSRPHAFRSRPI